MASSTLSQLGGCDVCVDESKRSGYVLAAVTVTDPAAVRRMVQGLVLPGQRRLHMKREQTRRRGTIVSALVEAPIRSTMPTRGGPAGSVATGE
jgi:hypothetical protein